MIYTLPYFIMIFWLIGGQIVKGIRRFGVPGITLIVTIMNLLKDADNKNDKNAWKYLVFLLFIPILCMGYGVDSAIKKVFKAEWATRLVYAIILSLPLGIYALISGVDFWKYLITIPALSSAFSIRAGKLFTVGKFDVLIEDIIRSLTLGYCILWIIK